MKNDNSQRKYRGFKYLMFVMFFFLAVGLVYFSRGPIRVDSRQAEVNDTAESMVANAKEEGNKLMAKANEMKEEMRDTLEGGRDKVSGMATNIAEKANQMAESATQSGGEWVDNAKSMVSNSDNPMNDVGYSNRTMAPVTKTSDFMLSSLSEEQDQMNQQSSAVSDQSELIQKTSKAMTADTSQVKAVMDASSSSMKSVNKSGATDQKGIGSVTIGRCPSPPDRGQDLGNRYIVAFCETMSIISKRTGVRVNDLININPQVENPDLIYPNQEIWLPPRRG